MHSRTSKRTSGISIRSALAHAWRFFRSRPLFSVALLPAVLLASLLINLSIGKAIALVPDPAGSATALAALMLAHVYFSVIVTRALLSATAGERVRIGEIIAGHGFWQLAGVTALTQLLIFVGLLAFVVPGIIFGIMYSFAPYIALEKGYGPVSALKESATMTKGIRLHLLLAGAALALVAIAGVLVLGVGVFITAPLSAIAHVYLYRQAEQAGRARAHPHDRGRSTNLAIAVAAVSLVIIAIAWVAGLFGSRHAPPALSLDGRFSIAAELRAVVSELRDGERHGAAAGLAVPLATGPAPYRSGPVSFVIPSGMAVVEDLVVLQKPDGSSWRRVVLVDAAQRPENPRILIEVNPSYWAFENDDAILDFALTPDGFRFLERLPRIPALPPSATKSAVASLVWGSISLSVFLWHADPAGTPSPVAPEALAIGLIESIALSPGQ